MAKRKRPGEFAPHNMDEDGNFIVGKGRPPEHGKFQKGDNRKRGRRKKGTRSLATDLREELESMVTVTVNGVPMRVTRQRAVMMRLNDNAGKGQNPAINLLVELQQKLVQPLIAKELAEQENESQVDYKKLTLEELAALEYLLSKAHNEPYNGGVTGVKTEYDPQKRLCNRSIRDTEE